MKARSAVLLALLSILLAACVPSVNPFYFDRDVVFDARLVGRWQTDEKGAGHWTFEKGDGKAYSLRIVDGGNSGLLEARLFRLKGELFLDTIPVKLDSGSNPGEVMASVIPGHLIFRVRSLEPRLRLEALDVDWLGRHLKEHPRSLAHRAGMEKDSVVLTATTAELQRFIAKHLKTGRLFSSRDEESWPRLPFTPKDPVQARP
jgi:hypothetical protein